MMRLFRRSLTARLLGYFMILMLFAVAILPVATYSLGRQSLEEAALERLNLAAESKENELNRWVSDNRSDVLLITRSPEFRDEAVVLLSNEAGSEEFQAAYDDLSIYNSVLISSRPSFAEILVLSTSGQALLSTAVAHEGENYADALFFINGRSNTYIQNIYISPESGNSTMTIATPMYDRGGRTLGILVVHLNLERLDRIILERAGLGETGETYLVNQNYAFVSEARYAQEAFPSGVHTVGIDAAVAGNDGSALYNNYRDVPVLGVYRWLEEREVALVAEINQDEAFAPAQQLALTIFLLGMAAVGALSVAVFLITRQVARPILAITNTATRVAVGDFSQKAPVMTEDELGTLAITFNNMTSQLGELIGNLEERVAVRTRELEHRSSQLEGVAEVGKAVASIRSLDDLLQTVTDLIGDKFGFYHVGIFLLDASAEYAVLRASNSPGGQRMLARGHRLAVGQKGIVGYVTGERMPRIAMDVGTDAVFFDNPDLPETRSEMALPLVAGGQLLGALDVQSTQESAFTQEDVSILQVLTDQIAVAIENANLFYEAQTALEVSRRVYGEASQEAWDRLLFSRPHLGYLADNRGRVIPVRGDWDSQMASAREKDRTIQVDENSIAIPIRIHGKALGAIRLRKPTKTGGWNSRETQIMESLVGQLGQTLESARLYADSQRRATQEQIVGEVSSSMRQSLNVDTVLRTAVTELQRVLGLEEIAIHLKRSDELAASPSNALPGLGDGG